MEAHLALQQRIRELERENEEARQYASNLVDALQQRLYPEVTGWTKLPDLLGILTQIDNMTAVAAAITPEMKGRIIKMAEIDDAEWDNFLVENGYPPSVKPAVTQLISDLRDLLGEQG